jgi:hypothetical protein
VDRLEDRRGAGAEDGLIDSAASDYVDGITAQWGQERPDLDVGRWTSSAASVAYHRFSQRDRHPGYSKPT